MTTDTLRRDTLHAIIDTYDIMRLAPADNISTLLFERFGFSERQVRQAVGLGPDVDLRDGLSAYLEAEHGIPDLA